MKKILLSLFSAIILFSFFILPVKAGTVMLGAKGWYAEWDSAFDKALADVLIKELGPGWAATVKPGTGYLLGPVIGYQTDDKVWSVSGALMLFSKFNNKTEYESSGVPVDTKTKMNRRDIDLALSFAATDFFKIFVGYKYITSKSDVNFDDGSNFYSMKSKNSIPTAGVAFAFQLTEKIAAGIQFGILYIMSDYKMAVAGGDYEEVKVDNGYGVNLEPNLSFLVSESVILQTGLRYQIYQVKFTDWGVTKNDRFFGITLGVLYIF